MWIFVLRTLGVLNLLFLDSLGLDVFFAGLFYLVDGLETRQAHLKLTIVRRAAPSVHPSDVIHFFFSRGRMKQNGSKSSQVRGSNRKEPLDSREVCCLDLDLGAADDDDDSWLAD